MIASKTLTAAIAAATIIGTVGYVSAQTTAEPAKPTQDMQQPVTPAPMDTTPAPATTTDTKPAPAATTSPSNVNTQSSSGDMSAPPATSDVNAAPAEPAPKADRN